MFKKDFQVCKMSALSAPEKAFDPSANILDCARVYFYIFFLEQIYNQDLEASANVHIRLKKRNPRSKWANLTFHLSSDTCLVTFLLKHSAHMLFETNAKALEL